MVSQRLRNLSREFRETTDDPGQGNTEGRETIPMSDTEKTASAVSAETSVPNELVVITYPGPTTATEARKALYTMAQQHLLEVEDSVVVTKDDAGEVHLHPVLSASFWHWAEGTSRITVICTIAGMFFGGLVGAAAGLVVGAVGATFATDALAEYGVDDDFVREVGASLQPGGSALAVLFHEAMADQVIPELAHFGGAVYRTPLSSAFSEKLRAALSRQ